MTELAGSGIFGGRQGIGSGIRHTPFCLCIQHWIFRVVIDVNALSPYMGCRPRRRKRPGGCSVFKVGTPAWVGGRGRRASTLFGLAARSFTLSDRPTAG